MCRWPCEPANRSQLLDWPWLTLLILSAEATRQTQICFFMPVAAPPHCARSSDVRQAGFFEVSSRLSDCAGFWPCMIGKQSQRIEHDDNRRPFVDEHGEAEASPAEQRCRNQQGNCTKRDEQVLADDRSRRAAQADGERKLAEIVAHQHDIRGFQRHVGSGATHGDANCGAGERGPVIGAVAYHGRLSILFNEASHYGDLVLGLSLIHISEP